MTPENWPLSFIPPTKKKLCVQTKSSTVLNEVASEMTESWVPQVLSFHDILLGSGSKTYGPS